MPRLSKNAVAGGWESHSWALKGIIMLSPHTVRCMMMADINADQNPIKSSIVHGEWATHDMS
jgi:hypothetical protein